MIKRSTIYFYVSSKNKNFALYSKKKKNSLSKTDKILRKSLLGSLKSPSKKCVNKILKFAEA